MTDMTNSIIAKSSQLNSDDLIGGAITVTITKVSGVTGDQPIAVNYEGDNDKPYMPCKTCRRVMVSVWGADAKAYTGRSMTLYRDPTVKWGGMEVGGIRISHMSHIDKPVVLALTATRGNKKISTIQPLKVSASAAQQQSPADKAAIYAEGIIAKLNAATTGEEITAIMQAESKAIDRMKTVNPALAEMILTLAPERRAELEPTKDVEIIPVN